MNDPQPKPEKKRGFLYRLFHPFRSKKDQNDDWLDSQLSSIDPSAIGVSHAESATAKEHSPSKTFKPLDDTVTEIPKPSTILPTDPIFVKQLDAKKYVDDLYVYMQDNGLTVSISSIREMFSSLAASKLIVVKHDDPAIIERFIELFSDFIGAFYYRDYVKSSLLSSQDLWTEDYLLKDGIIHAFDEENRIHFLSLKHISSSEIDTVFSTVLAYSWDPLIPCELGREESDVPKEMPQNTWFFVIPTKDEEYVPSIDLAQSGIIIELNATLSDPKEEVQENDKKLSYEFLTNLLLESYDKYYIEETEWKKIDKIEVYLKESHSFPIDNRLFRQLERYTSTYLLCGGDKHEAMDTALYVKLLQVISSLEMAHKKDHENGLFQLFETLFGLEHLTRSKNILKDIQTRKQNTNTIGDDIDGGYSEE